MALKIKEIAAIQVEYCTGNVTLEKIAKKHKVSIRTVIRLAQKHNWQRGECHRTVTENVLKKATDKFIEKESDRLAKTTELHITDIKLVRCLTRSNINDVIAAVERAKRKGGTLHKSISDNFFALQKVCKIASETLSICYKEERLAMGIDDDENKGSTDIEKRIKARMEKLKNADKRGI